MDLDYLKKNCPIYIIGHSNIDTDAAVSSKILCEIFNHFGIKSFYAILNGEYNANLGNKRMINDCMNFKPVIINKNDAKNYNWFFVDHNDRCQSIGNFGNVLGAIDHHVNTNSIKNILLSDICCTALFIYKLFKDKYDFSSDQKKQIFYAFLSDSNFGKSSRYKKSDGKLADELGFSSSSKGYNNYFKRFFIPTDLSRGMKFCMKNGYKKFNFDNNMFESNYIEQFGTKGLPEYVSTIKSKNNYLGIWIDYEQSKTYVYFNYKGSIKKFKYRYIASRASTIIPGILKYIKTFS